MRDLLFGVLTGLVIWAIGVLAQIFIFPFPTPAQTAGFWLAYLTLVALIFTALITTHRRIK